MLLDAQSPLVTLFKSSEEMACKNEIVYPASIEPISKYVCHFVNFVSLNLFLLLLNSITSGDKRIDENGIDKPSERDILYSRKNDICLNNRISRMHQHKNKHIHFDDDGNEIVDSTQVIY